MHFFFSSSRKATTRFTAVVVLCITLSLAFVSFSRSSQFDRNSAFIGYSEATKTSSSSFVDDDFPRRIGKVSRYEIGNLKPCENTHDDERKCLEWMKSGECAKNKNFMLAKCRKACQKCDEIYARESSERDDYVNVFFDVEVDPLWEDHFRTDGNDEGGRQNGRLYTNRVVFELFNDTHPKTSENFRSLITNSNFKKNNDMGISSSSYEGAKFHRIITGFMNQAGATKTGSIYGPKFDDENINSRYHEQPYVLAMANGGPNTSGDQFYVTVNPQPHLDGKHVVFGRVIRGESAVEFVNQKCGSESGRPKCDVRIVRCGEML